MPRPTPERSVQCYHCKSRINVPASARTGSCPVCYKGVVLDDLTVKDAGWNGKLTTCGSITVQRKGRAVCRSVEAGQSVNVEGALEARVACDGVVRLGPGARLKGDCHASTLVVEEGAVIEGGFFRITPRPVPGPPGPGEPEPRVA